MRLFLGLLMVFHGLAHSLSGTQAANAAAGWLDPSSAAGRRAQRALALCDTAP